MLRFAFSSKRGQDEASSALDTNLLLRVHYVWRQIRETVDRANQNVTRFHHSFLGQSFPGTFDRTFAG